jgi:hypothetical protein
MQISQLREPFLRKPPPLSVGADCFTNDLVLSGDRLHGLAKQTRKPALHHKDNPCIFTELLLAVPVLLGVEVRCCLTPLQEERLRAKMIASAA